MKLRFFLFALSIFTSCKSYGQNSAIDSLKNELTHHTREDVVRVDLLNELAFELHFIQPTDAANCAIEAGALAEKINYPVGRALSYRFLGLTFWAQSNLSAALNYFVKGLTIADSIENKQVQADITGNIGLVYSGMGNYIKALDYYKASLSKQRQLKNLLREAVMLNNVGDCYFNMKKYDSALTTYTKALEMGRSKNFGIATNTRNIGNVYEAMGNLDRALRSYYQAQQISDSQVDYRGMTQVRKSIASVFLKRKQYAPAELYVRECLHIATKAHLKAILRDSYELLSKIENEQAHPVQAFENFRLFTLYKDSIQNLSESSRIASLQLEYEMHSKQIEINALRKNSLLRAEELRLKNILLISAAVGISIIAFLLFNAVRNYRHKKLQHTEVLALNEKIRAHEKEVIMQRDVLVEKNNKIESLHRQVTEINEGLENTVALRTAALKEQNKHLEDYAFITSHELRAPVARILGIINLMEKDLPLEERNLMFKHLKKSSNELDLIIRSISKTLQQGLSAYDGRNPE